MDTLTPEKRSWNMSLISGKNTKPEITVRKLLHQMGYRFRLHRKDLPGRPDIVLPRYKTVIFVHGCFWHQHAGCKFAYMPKSRTEFWEDKFNQNIKRDKEVVAALKKAGWNVEVIWECETKTLDDLREKLISMFALHK